MGVYHQGAVVPVQTYIAENLENASEVIWWKTYSPPTWLLGEVNENLKTVGLMGAKRSVVIETLERVKGGCGIGGAAERNFKEVYFVAPLALSVEEEQGGVEVAEKGKVTKKSERGYRLRKVWVYRNHLGLDDLDLDFEKDEVLGAVMKVIGNRGLGIWRVEDVNDETCLGAV